MKHIALMISTLLLLTSAEIAIGEGLLQGSVQKTVSIEDARQQAFEGTDLQKDVAGWPAYDPFNLENLDAARRGISQKGNRIITLFQYHYCVTYIGEYVDSHYDFQGKLMALEFYSTHNPPYKTTKYSYPDGRLIAVNFTVTQDESFVFDQSGTLLVHWKGDYCYDADGKIKDRRTTLYR